MEWAKSQSLKVHTGFLLAVEELPETTGKSSNTAGKVGAGAAITTHKLKTKNMPLDAEIETAKSRALDKTNRMNLSFQQIYNRLSG